MRHPCSLNSVLRGEGPQLGLTLPFCLGDCLALSVSPTCPQLCLYLVAEISDFQGVGLATVGEVQAVVAFGGEHAVLEALLGDTAGEELLRRGGLGREGIRRGESRASVDGIPSGQKMDLGQEKPKGSEKRSAYEGRASLLCRENCGLPPAPDPEKLSHRCWNLIQVTCHEQDPDPGLERAL